METYQCENNNCNKTTFDDKLDLCFKCPSCDQDIKQKADMILNLSQDSRKKSILESLTDIIIGFLMYLPINFFILPMFANQIANQEIIGFLQITAIFTIVALVRKYTIRRWFSKMLEKHIQISLKQYFLRQTRPKFFARFARGDLKSQNFPNLPGGVSKFFACGAICVGGVLKILAHGHIGGGGVYKEGGF